MFSIYQYLFVMEIWSLFSYIQGLNLESEEEDDSDDSEEDDDEEEDRPSSKKSSKSDTDMDGPTRKELEQTAEGQYDLSEDEDVTGIAEL